MSADSPSVLEAARRLAPLVRENAAKTDADRELPKPVFHALADAGLYLINKRLKSTTVASSSGSLWIAALMNMVWT